MAQDRVKKNKETKGKKKEKQNRKKETKGKKREKQKQKERNKGKKKENKKRERKKQKEKTITPPPRAKRAKLTQYAVYNYLHAMTFYAA